MGFVNDIYWTNTKHIADVSQAARLFPSNKDVKSFVLVACLSIATFSEEYHITQMELATGLHKRALKKVTLNL